jgi:hypothetical protein
MFYTYAHYTPEGRLFYIGKGKGNRAYKFSLKRNYHWKNIVKKYGNPIVNILANWNTEKEAFEHEKVLIDSFRKLGYKLVNMTNGGEGTSGIKKTEDQKKAISLKQKGRVGVKPNEETRKKMSLARIGKTPWNKGIVGIIKASEETKQKLRASKTRYKTSPLKYISTNINTLERKTYIGIRALKENGMEISSVHRCINGTRKHHRNCTWQKKALDN